jgi:hypothetical protein
MVSPSPTDEEPSSPRDNVDTDVKPMVLGPNLVHQITDGGKRTGLWREYRNYASADSRAGIYWGQEVKGQRDLELKLLVKKGGVQRSDLIRYSN